MEEMFWDRTNKLIRERGYTQDTLSIKCKFRIRRIGNLSGRNTLPKADEVVKIAQALGVTAEYLITGKTNNNINIETLKLAQNISNLLPQDKEEIMLLVKHKLKPKKILYPSIDSVPKMGWSPDTELIKLEYYDVKKDEPLVLFEDSSTRVTREYPRDRLKGNPSDYFFIKVNGYSLPNDDEPKFEIDDGDNILLRYTREPKDRELMLILYDGCSTLKWLKKAEKGWVLISGIDQTLVSSNEFEVQGLFYRNLRSFAPPYGINISETDVTRKPKDNYIIPLTSSHSETSEPKPAYTTHKKVDNVVFLDHGTVEIPLVGSTAAGKSINFGDLDPDPTTRPWAADLIKGNPMDYYCVLVKGDSMSLADIKDGDYALLRHTNDAKHGEIMLVRDRDSSTLKRIKFVNTNGNKEAYICWEDGSNQTEKLGRNHEIQGKLEAIERRARKA